MSKKRDHSRPHGGPTQKRVHTETATSSTPLTPIQTMFTQFATQLDARHAQRDIIIVATRDLTQRSKKVISLLQRITTPESYMSIGKQAQQQLTDVAHFIWTIHLQLSNPADYYRLHRHYTGGIQEFIEALSFHHYLQHHTLISKHDVEAFVQSCAPSRDNQPSTEMHDEETPTSASIPPFIVSEYDYLNGILDLGGEIMRFATNSLTHDYRAGTPGTTALRITKFIVALHDAVMTIGIRGYEQKAKVLLESAIKCEQLCYKLFLRGGEIPPHMLTSLAHESFGARDDGGAQDGGQDDEG